MIGEGRVAIVTGGGRGIGRAVAVRLAKEGAQVAISYRSNDAAAEEAAEEVRGIGVRCELFKGDVAEPDDVKALFGGVTEAFGRVDILVNNAGVTRDRSFKKMDRRAWDEVINTNLNSVFDVTRLFIDSMAARRWGRVINISSIVGRVGNFGQANYSAAKAGLIGLTKTLAIEYASKGVTVNAIAPGFIKTRMLDGIPDKALQAVIDRTPVGRLGDPMEIGASVLYLASPAAGFVTGQVLDVNGGMAM
jgi:3-oxoacyl-[acyl-carrier protein] reductase